MAATSVRSPGWCAAHHAHCPKKTLDEQSASIGLRLQRSHARDHPLHHGVHARRRAPAMPPRVLQHAVETAGGWRLAASAEDRPLQRRHRWRRTTRCALASTGLDSRAWTERLLGGPAAGSDARLRCGPSHFGLQLAPVLRRLASCNSVQHARRKGCGKTRGGEDSSPARWTPFKAPHCRVSCCGSASMFRFEGRMDELHGRQSLEDPTKQAFRCATILQPQCKGR
jgi:hypothetical protein